jgi:hypothetical protein
MVTKVPNGTNPEESVSGRRIVALLDKANALQTSLVRKNIARARQRHPEGTPEQAVRALERMHLSRMTGVGAGIGATAAAPGVGTSVALALSAGEVLSSFEYGALFALSLAEIHGVPIDDLERRRAIVMGVLLGGSGSSTIQAFAERTGQHWAREAVAKVPAETLRRMNRVLSRNFITKYGTKQGVIVLGRVAPFGFGALIGGGMGAALAGTVVKAGRYAFGPAPISWDQSMCSGS